MPERGLNARQAKFVDAYLLAGNATQAAIDAGYSPDRAAVTGSELVRNRKVAAAIADRQAQAAKRADVSVDQVISALAAVAFTDLRDVVEWGTEVDEEKVERLFVRLKASGDLQADVAAAISEVRLDANGQLVVKLHDRGRALEMLGRHLGIFKRDLAVDVKVGITLDRLHELAEAADDVDAGD